jgi:proteic killer suppression protein
VKKHVVCFEKVCHLFKHKIPVNIVEKLYHWACRVEMIGLYETRKIKSFNDEPLSGKRFGQRSIRLNKAYRAFYKIHQKEDLIIVDVIEVNHHEY